MKDLKGKVAVVTGGNSGIGYATAKELKEQGAEVIITGRRKEAVEAAAAELGVTGIVADQGSLPAIEKLVADVKVAHSSIDILFVNAGVVGSSSSVENATEENFDYVLDINFKGAYFTLSRFIPLLKDGASVVMLSSNTASMNGANNSIYSSSKAALNAITKIAAVELAPRHIRVNAVSPGPIETDILSKAGYTEEGLKAVKSWIIDRVPLHHMGKAEDVARMVTHLCSDASSFITGSEFIMDGGMRL
ncbi:NAD(P)-dependent dehydrogenase, short-chain alcohol dehydrogenase family [Filimonas lacunae]|uniref:NAD(P)-dependent dehydrogenase, short-chain alcohol dehydrogenase family n=1 Tax=Filimonas lacunae TaxID=477680 RepID=A0A173MIM0_9BACT|nr:SDR family oxidoreductase [Filimonas lacunae]BAV07307.1 3-oxoacyl-[acyl-carrier protein] reductase [Filimonas lacunae]SIS91635.1 NAD(P)-dependent dehydrogenase, short-chain alcohol dehydrogenase family [Filimonas lacunae]